MLKRLKSLTSLTRPPKAAPLKGLMALKAIPDDPNIPAYPPHPKGLPAVDAKKALRKHFDALSAYQHMTDLTPEEFDDLLLPTIERFAGICHLLPASQSHHHRGAGGLLQHSLEVARNAVQFTRSVVFVPFGTPLERRTMEPRWRLVAGLAGLLHDAGKPFSDVRVVDKDGRFTWDPFQETIPEWAQRNHVDNYFVRWQDRRHKHHHTYNNAAANLVIQPRLVAWLRLGGEELWVTLNQVLSHQVPDHRIAKMVMDADRASVEIDLKRNSSTETQSYAIPVERHLLSAMNRLIEDGSWKVNEAGARVWVDKEHAYIVWKPAVEDIHQHLKESYVPGIPRGSEVLADILIERDLAVGRQIDLETKYRYWPIIPGALRKDGEKPIVLYALRLASKQQLWDQPPTATDVVVGDDAERELAEWIARKGGAQEDTDPHTPGRAKPLVVNAKRRDALRPGKAPSPPPQSLQNELPLDVVEGPVEALSGEALRPPERPLDEPVSQVAKGASETGPPSAPNQSGSENIQRQAPSCEERRNPERASPEPPAAEPSTAVGNEAMQLIERLAVDVRDGRRAFGEALCDVGEGKFLVRYPQGATLYADNPLEVVRVLREGGAIEVDPWTMRQTKTVGEITGLELTPAACAVVRAALSADRPAAPEVERDDGDRGIVRQVGAGARAKRVRTKKNKQSSLEAQAPEGLGGDQGSGNAPTPAAGASAEEALREPAAPGVRGVLKSGRLPGGGRSAVGLALKGEGDE